MRLLELFVTEKIGLTHLKTPLRRAIESAIIDSVYQIYYKEPKLDPGVRDLASSQVSTVPVNEEIKNWLTKQLKFRLALHIDEVLKEELSQSLKVKISDTGGAHGLASGLTMILGNQLIDSMVEKIVNNVTDYSFDYLESESDLISNLFRMYKRIAEDRGMASSLISDIESDINRLISVIIHEAVHLMQHLPQYKKNRPTLDYRGYLAKDKEEFYTAIKNVASGKHTEADYKLYRSSPQEISAFANELALKIADDYDITNLFSMEDFDLAEFKKGIPDLIRGYIFRMFDDPNNPKEYRVFKRFHKQVYQEFVRYTEQLEKKLKNKRNTERND